MNISFNLESVPIWMPVENRFCRACGKGTQWVVVAKGTVYTYPCCDNELCQQEVYEQITRAAENSASAK